MALSSLQIGKLKVSFYDIGTLAAGVYIGYNGGRGIDVSPTVEYLTKYGPTAFIVTATPMMIKLTSTFQRWLRGAINRGLQNGDLVVTLPNGLEKRYEDLDETQRQEITPTLDERLDVLDLRLQNPKYLESTLYSGAITAFETTIGYVAGRLCSRLIDNFLP